MATVQFEFVLSLTSFFAFVTAARSLSVVSSSADHLYFLSNETKTWDSAQQFCRSYSGRLVDILSESTQDALQTMLLSNPAGASLSGVAWIGLRANGSHNDSASYRYVCASVRKCVCVRARFVSYAQRTRMCARMYSRGAQCMRGQDLQFPMQSFRTSVPKSKNHKELR